MLGEPRADAADDRHLEPVEDPDRAEADDDEPVKARPRQPVEARRDPRLYRRPLQTTPLHGLALPLTPLPKPGTANHRD